MDRCSDSRRLMAIVAAYAFALQTLLLPFAPDWRWMWDRADSPWYPSMTLYRQPHRGGWGTVIARVADALRR